ncbi:MAG TPA: BMP family ABC transporter substrate-binding protein [Anaerolinea sp.]|nr:BMP family ABC transporter substrate-binding protein [Anaerolinea sp.]
MKRFSLILAVVMVLSLVLSACQPAAATPTTAPVKKVKICQVTDTGGIDDKSFNATAWKGVQDAMTKLGVDGKYLESKEVADYEKNLNAFIEEKCDLIVTVGFLLGDATKAAAEANTDVKFSIVDYSYDPAIPNVVGQIFQTDEAAFLAGYLAAGMTKTGKVGTFGGLPIPTVTIFMDGFVRGVKYHNQVKGTTVEVLGYDLTDANKGLFTNSFDDQTKGKEFGITLMDEGADIIMPVAGPVGLGTAAAVKERGNAWIIGVDSDWFLTASDYADIELTSVLKGMDATTLQVIQSVVDGTYKGGVNVVGTLANNGVGLAPYHNLDSQVPAELKTEIDQLKADIISGKIKLADIK